MPENLKGSLVVIISELDVAGKNEQSELSEVAAAVLWFSLTLCKVIKLHIA